jgi:hypothetical protein
MRTPTEAALQAAIAVVTSAPCIPIAYSGIRRGLVYESVIIICCSLTSIMYHVGEAYANDRVSIESLMILVNVIAFVC